MTKEKLTELLQAVKRSHWNARVGVLMFRKHNPDIELVPEDYGYAIGVGRTPFPNIEGIKEGPFPVYPERQFYDARLWETPEQAAWEKEMAELGE